ncbi:glutathione S-transferase family protein [Microvirga sp. KLBC 81]|uniref:glutathione S-transferase family protein n=1 Tax=Microvirga sp. KLBC 81 TaxID=1862707 RepID=UPI000D51B5DA|nr:glutathione S-transferase family protein [Microvirga sp. KLBC 81]PVE24744.1 glutathione S-transferase family protein [Microvirga sp. KLBC 81]
MKLYSGPLSLFSRKVETALHEKGLPFERIQVAFSQTKGYSPKHPDVLAANPKGQVPVLVDGDLTLYDSTLILEYLEDAYPDPALHPKTAEARARCRLLDLFADEVMLVPLRALMHRTEPKPDDLQRWTEKEAKAREAEAVLGRHYVDLDRRLEGQDYFCGAFSVADLAVFMTVFWTRRLGGPSLKEHKALAAWYARLSERPSFARVTAEIRAADRDLSAPVEGAYRE